MVATQSHEPTVIIHNNCVDFPEKATMWDLLTDRSLCGGCRLFSGLCRVSRALRGGFRGSLGGGAEGTRIGEQRGK